MILFTFVCYWNGSARLMYFVYSSFTTICWCTCVIYDGWGAGEGRREMFKIITKADTKGLPEVYIKLSNERKTKALFDCNSCKRYDKIFQNNRSHKMLYKFELNWYNRLKEKQNWPCLKLSKYWFFAQKNEFTGAITACKFSKYICRIALRRQEFQPLVCLVV